MASNKAKGFICGSIPGFEYILQKLKENPDEITDDDKSFKYESIKLIEDLKNCNKNCLKFIDFFTEWSKDRDECIQKITEISDSIDLHHRNCNVAQLPSAGLGIASGVLTIAGVALTPVTYGASLGLTIAGVAIGVVSAGGGAGANIADMVIQKKQLANASDHFDEHKIRTRKLIRIVSKLAKTASDIDLLYSQDKIDYIESVVFTNHGALARVAAIGTVGSLKSVYNLLKAIPAVVLGLKQVTLMMTKSPILHSIFDLAFSPGRFAAQGTRVAAQGVRVGAKAGAQAATAFGYIGGALGIVVSGAVVSYTIYDMVKNKNKADAANKLRNLCEQLKNEQVEMRELKDKVHEEINF